MSFRNSLLTALSEKYNSDSLSNEKTEEVVTENPKAAIIIESPKAESKVVSQILDILKKQDEVMEEFIEL